MAAPRYDPPVDPIAPAASSPRPLYRAAERAALLGIAVNLLLGVIKLAAGVQGSAFALVSDAVNSLGDAMSSGLVLLALRVAQRPADREHPYGHSRAEPVAAASVAILIVFSGLWVGAEAISRLRGPGQAPAPGWVMAIALLNALIMELLFRYKLRVGRRTGSAATIANAWDHRGDALSALAVLLGLVLTATGRPAFAHAGDLAALVVAVVILSAGIKLYLGSASDLMDVQAEASLVEEVRRLASSVTGVRAVETLRVRRTGLEHLADIHIQVDPKLSVDRGHRIGHAVKDRLIAGLPSLRDVLVHLEPHHPAEGPDLAPGRNTARTPEAGLNPPSRPGSTR